jgi:hypothetical protein
MNPLAGVPAEPPGQRRFSYLASCFHSPTEEADMRNLAIALLFVFGVASSPSAAMNASASGDDIANLCNIAYGMCYAACKRSPDSVSGVLQQGFCESDCDRTYEQCLKSGGIEGSVRAGSAAQSRHQTVANRAIFQAN